MSTPTQEDTGASIVKTEGVLGGKPRLAGHRISVLDVTELLEAGYSVSGAAEQLGITVDEVRAATRYFRRHRDELAELARRRREAHGALQGSGTDTTTD